MRGKLLAVLVLIIPAWLTLPLTDRIHRERRELKYGGAYVDRKLRLDLGQGLAIGLLAGFRGVVADFVWIQGHSFWERREWLRQYRNIRVAVTLQPQSTLFWDTGAWHMAWNIGYAVSVDTNVYTQAQAIQRQREWWQRAESFLKEGIENVPNRYDLYFSLGWLYDQKFKDYCSAAEYFGKAMSFPDAPAYIARVHARAEEKCGNIRGAYAYWLDLWTQDHTKVDQNWSVIEREIRRLEDALNIPNDVRVFPKTNPPPPSAHP